jgi:hypothetical protein
MIDVSGVRLSDEQVAWLDLMLADRTEPFVAEDCGWQILQAVYNALPDTI